MPRSGTISLAGLGLALRLHALDRWPTLVSSPRVWDRLGFAEPFDYRWNSRPVPAEAQRAYDAVASLETSTPVTRLRSARNDRIARHR